MVAELHLTMLGVARRPGSYLGAGRAPGGGLIGNGRRGIAIRSALASEALPSAR